jgi:hypothetical protein
MSLGSDISEKLLKHCETYGSEQTTKTGISKGGGKGATRKNTFSATGERLSSTTAVKQEID